MVDEGFLDKHKEGKAMQWIVKHYENRDIHVVVSIILCVLLTALVYMGAIDSASLCQALCEAKGNDYWEFRSSILSNENGCFCGGFNPRKASAICKNLTRTRTEEYWPQLDETQARNASRAFSMKQSG